MSNKKGLRLGSTLFSFTNEYHSRQYSLEQLLEEVAKRNIGPGVEIVGFSAIRGFPHTSDEFASHFRDLIAKLGLEPSCLGINADVYLRPDQPMTADESLAYHRAQIESAAKLGFPVARYQFLAGPEVIRRLLPTAEKLNVKLGLEIHAPHKVDSVEVMQYREMYAKENSPYLGFIPDFGASATAISPAFLRYVRKLGLPEGLISLAQKMWAEPEDPKNPHGKIEAFTARAQAEGLTWSRLASVLWHSVSSAVRSPAAGLRSCRRSCISTANSTTWMRMARCREFRTISCCRYLSKEDIPASCRANGKDTFFRTRAAWRKWRRTTDSATGFSVVPSGHVTRPHQYRLRELLTYVAARGRLIDARIRSSDCH